MTNDTKVFYLSNFRNTQVSSSGSLTYTHAYLNSHQPSKNKMWDETIRGKEDEDLIL